MSPARARLVGSTMLGLLGGEVRRAVGVHPGRRRNDDLGSDRQAQRARAVRQALEDLGPLYIKVGQMLSTRPDICPEYLMEEFENLHAKVSVSPFTEFEPVLEDELGSDWKRYFRDVDTTPIGCASLAQVYRVQLKSGKDAVVKIQRPGVRASMLEDMALLAKVVRQLAKRMPRPQRRARPRGHDRCHLHLHAARAGLHARGREHGRLPGSGGGLRHAGDPRRALRDASGAGPGTGEG